MPWGDIYNHGYKGTNFSNHQAKWKKNDHPRPWGDIYDHGYIGTDFTNHHVAVKNQTISRGLENMTMVPQHLQVTCDLCYYVLDFTG